MKPRKPEPRQKKSETLDVRVPWRLKRALMDRARRENRSASEIVRGLIEDYLDRSAQRTLSPPSLETVMKTVRKHPRPAFAAILGAAGLSALLAGVIPAGAAPNLRAAFDTLDADGDGVVSEQEFNQPNENREFVLRRVDGDDAAPEAASPAPTPNGRIMLPITAPDGAPGGGQIRMIVRSRFAPNAEPLPGARRRSWRGNSPRPIRTATRR